MNLRRYLNKCAIGFVLHGAVLGTFLALPVKACANDTGTVQMYPLWNEYPQIIAKDRYISTEEIASGRITEEELLSKVTVTDKEDGTGSKHLLRNTDTHRYVTIPDFSEEEFAAFLHDGTVSVTVQAVDSCGCMTQKRICIHIVDTGVKEVPQMQVRFVSEEYLDTVAGDSVWRQQEEYKKLLQETVAKEKEAGQKLLFSKEEVSAAKQYMEEHGHAGSREGNSLRSFYQKFCDS